VQILDLEGRESACLIRPWDNLKALPTNPSVVTISTDRDLSSRVDVRSVKRKYILSSISLLKGFPGSRNCLSKAVAVMKAFNLAGTVDLGREFV